MDRSEATPQPQDTEPPKPDKAERQKRSAPAPESVPLPDSQWLSKLAKQRRTAAKSQPKVEKKVQPAEEPQPQQTKEEPKSEDEGSSQEQFKVEPKGEPAAEPLQWSLAASQEAQKKACQDWDRPERRASIMAAMQRALECTACSWRGASKGCRQCLREWEPFYRLTVPGYEFWVGQKVPEQ